MQSFLDPRDSSQSDDILGTHLENSFFGDQTWHLQADLSLAMGMDLLDRLYSDL